MIGDAIRIQNTVFDVNFVASEVVFQPLHSDTGDQYSGSHLTFSSYTMLTLAFHRLVGGSDSDVIAVNQPQLLGAFSMYFLSQHPGGELPILTYWQERHSRVRHDPPSRCG